jgi:hypothetical protein
MTGIVFYELFRLVKYSIKSIAAGGYGISQRIDVMKLPAISIITLA